MLELSVGDKSIVKTSDNYYVAIVTNVYPHIIEVDLVDVGYGHIEKTKHFVKSTGLELGADYGQNSRLLYATQELITYAQELANKRVEYDVINRLRNLSYKDYPLETLKKVLELLRNEEI